MSEADIYVTEIWYVRVWRRHRHMWSARHFRTAMILSALVFIAGVALNGYSTIYATERASNYVTDIVLSNTPVVDVDGTAVYGVVVLVVCIILLCLIEPAWAPFVLYSLGLFFAIRAGFVSMTHLAPFPLRTPMEFTSNIGIYLGHMLIGEDDLFFSAHTGVPFLMALLFWHKPLLRYAFLVWSVFFGIVVLVGHLHYTIDVASAFFITYGIYHLALWLFPQARALFMSAE